MDTFAIICVGELRYFIIVGSSHCMQFLVLMIVNKAKLQSDSHQQHCCALRHIEINPMLTQQMWLNL